MSVVGLSISTVYSLLALVEVIILLCIDFLINLDGYLIVPLQMLEADDEGLAV